MSDTLYLNELRFFGLLHKGILRNSLQYNYTDDIFINEEILLSYSFHLKIGYINIVGPTLGNIYIIFTISE